MTDSQERMVRAAMAQPRVLGVDPDVQVEQEPHWFRCDDDEAHPQHGTRGRLGRTRCTGLPVHRCIVGDPHDPHQHGRLWCRGVESAPLARVGDVIEHGQAIPANVVGLRDVEDDLWGLTPRGHWHMENNVPGCNESCPGSGPISQDYFPYTVTEVDPEPQPACFKCGQSSGRIVEVSAAKPRFMHAYGSCESNGEVTERVAHTFGLEWPRPKSQSAAEVLDLEPPAESGPVVLSLPQVPDGAVALVGGTSGKRFARHGDDIWGIDGGTTWRYRDIMFAEGSVTVEFAPPREPRTWPKLDPGVTDLPTRVTVDGWSGVWVLAARPGGLYRRTGEDELPRTLAELIALGEVREVLT